MHFFEALERKIDFQKEFDKIEDMIIQDHIAGAYGQPHTVHLWMTLNFRNWKQRGNYTTLEELREQLGFKYTPSSLGRKYAWNIDINRFFLYCEMLLNLFFALRDYSTMGVEEQMKYVLETIETDVERSGFEIREIDEEIIIVEKNPVAIEVAEYLPDISDVIVEYNHYLLKGNLKRKQEILKKIADAMEPLRKELEAICRQETSDYFFMINNMNVRHNNCNSNDKKHYCKEFAALSEQDKEKWYDIIYDQALALLVIRKQAERDKTIAAFKQSMEN